MGKLAHFVAEKLNLEGKGYRRILCYDKYDNVAIPCKGPSRSTREAPPTHYTFKINSFSIFSKLSREGHTFGVFEAGGYKWNLSLYPNGNKKENGEGHLSLYLVMADANSLTSGWEVKAIFRLFVFNQIHGKYLMLEDTHERCFHAMKKEWGFSQFIPLKTFNKPSKGYLVDDSCVFGAEVFVINERSTGKGDCISMIKGARSHKHIWKIKKFSKLDNEWYYSKTFDAGEYNWRIKLFPKGIVKDKSKSISLFLTLDNSSTLPPARKVYVDFNLLIIGQAQQINNHCRSQSWFDASNKIWGCQNFISLSKLHDPKNGFMVDDSFIIEAEVTVLGVANTMS